MEKIPYYKIEEADIALEIDAWISELVLTGHTMYASDFRRCDECGDWFPCASSHGNRRKCSEYCKTIARKKLMDRHKALHRDRTKLIDYCYPKIKKQAEERGIAFNLTIEEYGQFHGKPCHYCGGEVMFGSLDRLDSSGLYEVGNVVPCCGVCNRCKFHSKYLDFIDWANRIAKNHPRDV